MNTESKKIIRAIKPAVCIVAGSFVIAAGWSWYHFVRRPYWLFAVKSCIVWALVLCGYLLFKRLYAYLVSRFRRHEFWKKEFYDNLDSLFLVFSLTFVVFFFRSELLSLLYFLAVAALLFACLHHYLGLHPDGKAWRAVNARVFVFVIFLFAVLSVVQYAAYHYYILDSNIKYYDIVLFRSWAMTMFWVFGFAVASMLYWKIKHKILRYLFLGFWSLLFVGMIVLWIVNAGVMYFTGLYLNPAMLGYVSGAGTAIFNWLTPYLVGGGGIVLIAFFYVFSQAAKTHGRSSRRYWAYYNSALIAVAVFSLVSLSSFENTPEYTIVRNFISYFSGQNQNAELSPVVQAKLERFGLHFNTAEFSIAHRSEAFTPAAKALWQGIPSKNHPNVILFFFESFSSRLTDVYNPNFKDLTPGLDKMAADPDTTVFHNYYNASTPTITGILSQLCSFLPPTGYNEINNDKKLQRIYALCLPQILKDSGYKYTGYVTAVDKTYEDKFSILSSIGADDIYGTSELARYISGEPLSWGYSDHQMLPAFEQIINQKAKTKSPFLAMISTIDSHPPFNLSKDMLKFGDGKNDLLNSVHTTDDAFAKFWDDFRASDLAKNTILIAVADHAVFPAGLTKDAFPDEAGKMSYYDENMLMMYVPHSTLPKTVDVYSSGLDFAPTLLQILNINTPNSFEGHSIFDDQKNYPNLLGMHELGLYINQAAANGKRSISYDVPDNIVCSPSDYTTATDTPLTLCEYLDFYGWEKQMFEQGRMW